MIFTLHTPTWGTPRMFTLELRNWWCTKCHRELSSEEVACNKHKGPCKGVVEWKARQIHSLSVEECNGPDRMLSPAADA